jgi:Lipocalin-like domain
MMFFAFAYKSSLLLIAALVAEGFGASSAIAADAAPTLAGAWTLVYADVLHADGTRGHDYGDAPKGLLLIDDQGRYSLQIFNSQRPRFAGQDKQAGTPAEFAAAILGCSTHFGTLKVDAENSSLTFDILSASFPNLEGTRQTRLYQLQGDELSYRIAPRSNGDVPVSAWRRIK